MEIIGKFLFLILFSVSIGAGAVYVVGPTFFSSNLDNNLFDSERAETTQVDVKEYRKKLGAEYDLYNDRKGSVSNRKRRCTRYWENNCCIFI